MINVQKIFIDYRMPFSFTLFKNQFCIYIFKNLVMIKKILTFPNDLLLLCLPALSLRLRLNIEDLLWSAALCSFFAALNCWVANSSALALFGITPRVVKNKIKNQQIARENFVKLQHEIVNKPRWILSLFPDIRSACQDPTTPLCRVSTTWKTSDLSKDNSPLSGWA